MRYVVDHDLHIHTILSVCAADEGQIPDSIIKEAKEAGYKQIVLTDTVGFISKLPHNLVDAFASTLEEAKDANLILHIID